MLIRLEILNHDTLESGKSRINEQMARIFQN